MENTDINRIKLHRDFSSPGLGIHKLKKAAAGDEASADNFRHLPTSQLLKEADDEEPAQTGKKRHRKLSETRFFRNRRRLIAMILIGVVLVGAECVSLANIHAENVLDRRSARKARTFLSTAIPAACNTIEERQLTEIAEVAKQTEEAKAKQAAEDAIKAKAAASIIHPGWSGAPLSRSSGSKEGPSGKETYYNLDMSGVVRNMRSLGFSEAAYPYNVRADGAKCLGPYIMVAAYLPLRPKGMLVTTSMGIGIVADTGGFAASNHTQMDLATNW